MSEAEPDGVGDLRSRHEALRDLLDRNGDLLELLAEIQFDLRLLVPGDPVIRARTRRLLDGTLLQAQTANLLAAGRHESLYAVHSGIEADIRRLLSDERDRLHTDPLVVPLAACRREAEPLVGGKAARLGDLAARLPQVVPEGFVVTTVAYARLLGHGGLGHRLRELLQDVDLAADAARLRRDAAEAQALLLGAPIPDEVTEAIQAAAGRWSRVPRWAVRSSAVGEDGPFSFAGQFESVLDVDTSDLPSTWRRVVASGFSEHAIHYRLVCGLFELATPMAVLSMPMVDARVAGVLYTRDPSRPRDETMIVSSLAGVASDLVRGAADAETLRLPRTAQTAPRSGAPARPPEGQQTTTVLFPNEQTALASLGLRAEEVFGEPLDIEWAIDRSGRPFLLQARPLTAARSFEPGKPSPGAPSIAQGGVTIVGGRAVGDVWRLGRPWRAEDVPEGSILVVAQAAPELGHLLARIEGLVAEQGNLTGHLAALARAFGVPSVFGMRGATAALAHGSRVSLDAGRCEVYSGEAWPAERQESRRRARDLRSGARNPLHRLILQLDLTDPRAAAFRPGGCRSLHDIVRFCHERGVASLFEAGGWRPGPRPAGARRLRAEAFPDAIWVLDTGGGIAPAGDDAHGIAPARVLSRPFQALWRGMTAPGIVWSGRRNVDLRGFASVVSSSLTEPDRDAGSLGGAAYVVVAQDYLNFNARLAYHYAMIDSFLGEVPESNYVIFRFWGGGAGRAQRDLRAMFLAQVLDRLGFAVERRGDLVTARLRRYPERISEQRLESLGKLMGCARQLDMLLHSEAAVSRFVDHFVGGRYGEFA